ncbi:MAG: carboxypeptidase-like regulatory domain-containing protein, partial [Actinomycetia bacterium]|nr:carboxypeptidase-like regulatory domain-containing protein [Actinomycetes bacterium]
SVGAYAACSLVKDSKGVVNIDGSFPGNAPKHYAGGVTLTLTSPCSQVYLYTHFEAGSLSWYPSLTDYRFVGDKLVDTTVTKDAWVRDDIAADYWVRDDSTTENMTAAYDGAFSVSVADASGVVWTCDGTLAMCGQATLAPGTYTVTLSAVGLDPIDQTVTVIAGQAVTADFGAITVQGDPEFVTADKTYLPDIVLAKVYLDPVYTDVIGAPIYLNGPLKNI